MSMTNEQKEIIYRLERYLIADKINLYTTVRTDDLDTALSLIKEQEKEIDILKNHVHYKICENCKNEFRSKRSDAKYCKECAKTVNNKEWYKNLTDEQKEKRREQSRISMRNIRERRKQNDK